MIINTLVLFFTALCYSSSYQPIAANESEVWHIHSLLLHCKIRWRRQFVFPLQMKCAQICLLRKNTVNLDFICCFLGRHHITVTLFNPAVMACCIEYIWQCIVGLWHIIIDSELAGPQWGGNTLQSICSGLTVSLPHLVPPRWVWQDPLGWAQGSGPANQSPAHEHSHWRRETEGLFWLKPHIPAVSVNLEADSHLTQAALCIPPVLSQRPFCPIHCTRWPLQLMPLL